MAVWRLADKQTETTTVSGTPATRAFDRRVSRQAAEGFAQGKGLSVKDLKVAEIDGGQYVVAEVKEETASTYDVLLKALPGLVAGIKFDKTMRWNQTNVAYSRPLRWFTALLGNCPVPFEYAGMTASNVTRGLRFYEPEEIKVSSIAEYPAALEKQGIILDPELRKETIRAQVLQIMRESGAVEKMDEDLLDEVTALVEAPTALRGSFEEEHLKLPPEVLISVMKKHQRYFPLQNREGKLLPYFIAVRNGDENGIETVADGNAQVIRPAS